MISRFWRCHPIRKRTLSLEALEERIVLDAAVDSGTQDNPDDNPETTTDNGSSSSQADGSGSSSDGQNQDTSDPVADVWGQKLSVVLVSNALDETIPISDAVGADTTVIYFDAETADLDTLIEILGTLVDAEGMEIGHLSIVSHGESGILILSANEPLTTAGMQADAELWEALGDLLADDCRIDLYGCEIGKGQEGEIFVETMAALTGAVVWASDDSTGNVDGADWDLEVQSGESDLQFLIDGDLLAGTTVDLANQSWENVGFERGDYDHWGVSGGGTFTIVEDSSGSAFSNSVYYVKHTGSQGTLATSSYLLSPTETLTIAFKVTSDSGYISWGVYQLGQGTEGALATGLIDSATSGWVIYTVDVGDSYGSPYKIQIHMDMGGGGTQYVDIYETQCPYLDTEISDKHTTEDQITTYTINLANYFDDDDTSPTELEYSLDSDYSAFFSTAEVNGTTLTLVTKENAYGTVEVRVGAEDESGLMGWGVFDVVIDAKSDAPVAEDFTVTKSEGTESITITAWADHWNDYIDSKSGDKTDKDTAVQIIIDSLPDVGTLELNGVELSVGSVVSWDQRNNIEWINDGGSEYSGTTSFTYQVQDSGDAGANLSNEATVTIEIKAVNDAPEQTLPDSSQMVTREEEPLNFGIDGVDAIQVTDVDANDGSSAGELVITLTATNGTLDFRDDSDPAQATLTFTGTLDEINDKLAQLTFIPDVDFYGTASIQVTTNDQGNYADGTGSPKQVTDTISIEVQVVNDPPENTVPVSQSTAEDTTLVFQESSNSLIQIWDDAESELVQVTLTATNGTLTLSGIDGLDFEFVGDSEGTPQGTGTDDAVMTFRGTVDAINAALDGMSFTPTEDYNGSASVRIVTNDLGNLGQGGPYTDDDTVQITITPVNDAPENTIPDASQLETFEDQPLVFGSAGVDAIVVGDVDANEGATDGELTVTLSAVNGTLEINSDGNQQQDIEFTGTLTAINSILNTLVFHPDADFYGTATVTITTNDNGNYAGGTDNPLATTNTFNIEVKPVNDAPVNTVPSDQTTDEESPVVFDGDTLFSISDDAEDHDVDVQVTLIASNGTLTLGSTTGLDFDGDADGTDDATMTFRGTVAEINDALKGMTFDPTTDFYGSASVQIITNDLGHHGEGDPLTDDDTVNITVNPVNDAPVNLLPSVESTDEDTSLVFSVANGNSIQVSDPDNRDGHEVDVEVTLTSTNGLLTLGDASTVTFVGDSADGGAVMTFRGTIAEVNQALDGLTFNPTADYNGPASVQIVTSDMGNIGSGTTLTDNDTVDITVQAVNDAPGIEAPDSVDGVTGRPVIFESEDLISVYDIDAGTEAVQITLRAGHGTLTLSGTTGLSFSGDGGNGENTMTFSGTLSDVNAALDGLTYTSDSDYEGEDTISVICNDLGHTPAPELSVSHSIEVVVAQLPIKPPFYSPLDILGDSDPFEWTVGEGPALDVVISFLGDHGLLPISESGGYDSDLFSGGSLGTAGAEFRELLFDALFAEDSQSRDQAWHDLYGYLENWRKPETEERFVELEQFFQKLEQWPFFSEVHETLVFNEIELYEWLNSLLSYAQWSGDSLLTSATGTDSLPEVQTTASTLLLDLHTLKIVDLFAMGAGGDAFTGVDVRLESQPEASVRLFELGQVSLSRLA